MIADRPAERIAQCTVEPLLGGISIVGLAAIRPKEGQPLHEAMEIIETACHGTPTGELGKRIPCADGARFRVARFFETLTACDACRAKADKAQKMERAKTYWEAICPPSFRDTAKDHPGFPKQQYAATVHWDGGESLFFKGPTRRGKTRLAIWLLKRCLVRFNQHVGVMWPEQLKTVKGMRDVSEWIGKWGKYDVLLMDDALMAACSDGRCTEGLKDLLDFRQRHKKQNIVTSQIGEDDVAEQIDKYGKSTRADKEMVKALCARLREECRVVAFDQPVVLPPRQRELVEEPFG